MVSFSTPEKMERSLLLGSVEINDETEVPDLIHHVLDQFTTFLIHHELNWFCDAIFLYVYDLQLWVEELFFPDGF